MDNQYQINEQISARKVKLVLPDGELFGDVDLSDAMSKANEFNMDLVLVSQGNKESLPVCKILDYGKLKYHEEKKRGKQPKHHIKEIKYRFNTSLHDIKVKHNKVAEFISKHYKVKYVMELNGREKAKIEDAQKKMEENLMDFIASAEWKAPTVSHDKNSIQLITTLNPK